MRLPPPHPRTPHPAAAAGFSLIELLVVIGIIAILIGILMPTLSRVRQHAKQVACQSNMRQIGQLLLIYANTYDGYIFPLGAENEQPRLGVWVGPDKRWPVLVKGLERWNHPLLLCPQDEPPVLEEHSYALNWHFFHHGVRFHTGSEKLAGLKPADIILMGEKRAEANNYFLGSDHDYDYAADEYKHGLRLGSNYLFLDLHVSVLPPKANPRRRYDPWGS
jgi:prepilin-type N-terminal cleavage/methylation domain-containing protein